jgi:AbrB family looped-hinge helix DNA binding protein
MKDMSAQECFFGSVTVGERGQVVIPSDVRKDLHIEPGDRLLVFREPIGKGVMLTKLDHVHDVVQHLQSFIEKINAVSNEDRDGEGD